MSVSMFLPRAIISQHAIKQNFMALHSCVNHANRTIPLPSGLGSNAHWPALMPVLKGDAYGHGYAETGLTLCKAGASVFCSGSMDESVALRQSLSQHNQFPAIIALLGPLCEEDIHKAVSHAIIPVIHSMESLELLKHVTQGSLPIAIKLHTGMARLGFAPDAIPAVIKALKHMPYIQPALVMSHLACGDDPQAEHFSDQQIATFASVLAELRKEWPGIAASIANSAGTFLHDKIAAVIGEHSCRPGLTLYGANPFASPLPDCNVTLHPAMQVYAPVMSIRTLQKGETYGYSRTFTAPQEMTIAVIGIGYADGLHRGLSNKGHMCLHQTRVPIVGRVSMQMTAVDITNISGVKVGDKAFVLGGSGEGRITPQQISDDWQTIPYEVFCILGKLHREFIE